MQITRRMQLVAVDLMRARSHACPSRRILFVRFVLAFAIIAVDNSANVIDREYRTSFAHCCENILPEMREQMTLRNILYHSLYLLL